MTDKINKYISIKGVNVWKHFEDVFIYVKQFMALKDFF